MTLEKNTPKQEDTKKSKNFLVGWCGKCKRSNHGNC